VKSPSCGRYYKITHEDLSASVICICQVITVMLQSTFVFSQSRMSIHFCPFQRKVTSYSFLQAECTEFISSASHFISSCMYLRHNYYHRKLSTTVLRWAQWHTYQVLLKTGDSNVEMGNTQITVNARFNIPSFSEIPDLVMIFSCPNNSSL
jgi:hypothetical protein